MHKEISDIGGVAWSTVLSPDSNYFYSSLSHYYHPPYGDAPALLKMDINGNVVDIYDLAPINDYGKMIMAKFVSDTTLMASAVWGNTGPPKAVIIDTLGNIIHQANLLDNEWMANTEVTFDGKLLFLTNIHDEYDNFDTYLFKLNQQLESDTFYTTQFTYDSLCPYQISSDTIVQDDCGLIVGMEEVQPEKAEDQAALKIYPNPTKNKFNISIPAAFGNDLINSSCIIEIFDVYGRKVKEIKVPKGQNEIEVDIEGWRKGLYLVRVRTEQSVVGSEKVIIN